MVLCTKKSIKRYLICKKAVDDGRGSQSPDMVGGTYRSGFGTMPCVDVSVLHSRHLLFLTCTVICSSLSGNMTAKHLETKTFKIM